MKGLLLSRFLSWRIKSSWFLFILIIALGLMNYKLGIFSEHNFGIFYIFYFCTTLLCGGTMMFGERYSWDKYISAMPVSRKQIIVSHYIEIAVYEACIYMSFIISESAAIMWNNADISEFTEILAIISAAVIAISVSAVISSAFGGRTGQRCGALINIASITAIMYVISDLEVKLAVYMVIAAIIIRAVSIPLSAKLYAKKDL